VRCSTCPGSARRWGRQAQKKLSDRAHNALRSLAAKINWRHSSVGLTR